MLTNENYLERLLSGQISINELILALENQIKFSNIYLQFVTPNTILYWKNLTHYFAMAFALWVFYKFFLKSKVLNFKTILSLTLPFKEIKYKTFKFDIYFYLMHILNIFPLFVMAAGILSLIYFMPIAFKAIGFYEFFLIKIIHEFIFTISPDFRVILIFLLAFLLLDFFTFLGHYALHKIPLLWCFHQIHHYPEQMTIISTVREHPICTIFISTLPSIAMSLIISIIIPFEISIASSPSSILDNGLIFSILTLPTIFAYFNHSKFPISFGKFEYIFLSPNSHLVHHSKHIVGKNMGSILSIWDQIFGTFYKIKDDEEFMQIANNLGTDDANDNEYDNFFALFTGPFKKAYGLINKKRLTVL